MRLAVVRQEYPPYGGGERYVEAALEALLERNVAISLYARQWPQTKLQLIEPVVCNPFYIGRFWRDRGFARAACRAIAKAEPDLVESYERLLCCDIYRARDGVHAVALEEWARVESPWSRQALRLNPYHRHLLAVERRIYASPWLRAVICRSRMVRDEIQDRFGVGEDRLHVIHDAVDTDAFHPGLKSLRGWVRERSRISDSATLFLLVGAGYRRQGVATAIAALAQLAPTAHLMVLGAERNPARFVRLTQLHGVAERVTFVGPQIEPKPYYGAADVLLLPTLYDPSPTAALEAMACGLPVITSLKSGAAELVQDHDAGLVCDALDVAALAGHMRRLQGDAERTRLAANARAAALVLSPAAITLKLVLLYRDLLAASAAAKAQSMRTAGTDFRHASTVHGAAVTQHSAMDLVPPELVAPPAVAAAAAEIPMDNGQPPPPVLEWRVEPEAAPPEVAGSLAMERAPPARSAGSRTHGSNRG